MKRILIIASHEKMADGMKDTLNFISGGIQETIALSAYVDNRPVEEAVDEVMDGFEGEDEVVVLTDLMVGSVNQKFFKYRTRPHTHIVSGMNLPLAFQIAMEPQGKYITEERMKEIIENVKLVEIQRSRGYMLRDSLFPEDIKKIVDTVKAKNPDTICFVDNCYGEFTCKEEPIELGADITAGSLIKNAGGGFAPTGAYICGKADLVELCAHAWTAPGLGSEMGSYAASYRPFFEGLFMAPHVTRQAMMSAEFCSSVFKILGFSVTPEPGHLRTDLITAITLDTEENMCRFAEAVQSWSPVDSDATPIPGPMPGYVDPIIMAAGTFVQGSTIEMSADGPVRPPYIMYFQGGLVFEHALLAVMGAAERILESRNEL